MFSYATKSDGVQPIASDSNFNQVSVLLHGDGTNGAQNNTFLDSSTNNFTITRNGTATQGTYTPFSQAAGYWSNNFNGTSDLLSLADNAQYTFGTSNFTIEAYVYNRGVNAGSQAQILSKQNPSPLRAIQFRILTGNTLDFVFTKNGGTLIANFTTTSTVPTNQWVHIAVVRNGVTLTLYINGVSSATHTLTAGDVIDSPVANVIIGGFNASFPNAYVNGYISNFRWVIGTAVYTSAFTPSTTPLTAITNTRLLTCQSSYFVDNSSNNFTISQISTTSAQPWSPFAPTSAYSTSVNGGSGYFNGGTDELQVPQSTALDFGSSNFTVEAWVYINGSQTGSIQNIFNKRVSNGVFLGLTFTGGNYYTWIWIDGTSVVPTNNGTPVPKNQWVHLAYVRSANNFRTYINGVLNQNVTLSITASTQNGVSRVGNDARFSQAFGGYISNLRVVIGSVVYAAAFTPPTAPLTAITNTQLLLSGTNAGIVDNAIKSDSITVGATQVNTSVVKYGTGSISFNGTTSVLNFPNNPYYALGNGSFTIEAWVYPNSVTALQSLIDTRSTATATTGILISITALGFISITVNNAILFTSSTGITISAWTHLAVVKSGTTITLYLNGTKPLTGSGTSSTSLTDQFLRLGASAGTAANFYNGYLDEVRITNGVARYLANFTAPTAPFPNL
jgi:hypothetical protein